MPQLPTSESDAPLETRPGWFRDALDAMLDLVAVQVAIRDENGAIVDFEIAHLNKVNIDVAGRPREDLVGGRMCDLYPAMAPLLPRFVDVVETGEPLFIDQLAYEDTIDENEVSGYYALQVSRFGDGIIVVSRDVTEQHRVHRELADTVDQLDTVQQLADMGVWTIDLETNDVWFSSHMRRIFGLSERDAVPHLARIISQYFPEADAETLRAARRRLEEGAGPVRIEVQLTPPGMPRSDLLIYADVIPGYDGSLRLWGSAQDVTGQRRAERALGTAWTRLAEQRHLVEELQAAIMPVVPQVPGVEIEGSYYPAAGPSRIGGDWYDAFVLPDGRIGLVVGDVTGHGLPAAAAMAQLRNAVRAEAFLSTDPAATLSRVSYYALHGDLDLFATVLYVLIDREQETLSWSHAGHPPAMLRAGGTTTVLDGPGRPPIGFRHNEDFPLNQVELPPEALIVLYTDGLVERRGEVIDIGLERLRGALSDGPFTGTCTALRAAMNAELSEDDTCILVARLVTSTGVVGNLTGQPGHSIASPPVS